MKNTCLLLVSLLLASCASVPTTINHDVPNLRLVSPGIYRGGQPITADGWAYLKGIGVTNVVKLNRYSEGSDVDAITLGMTVGSFPIDITHQVLVKPDSQTVSNAVAAIAPGTYIHCEHGQDRTGLIVGCYRVWRQGWPKDKARKEMLDDGFHTALHGLNDYWEDNVK